MNTPSRALGVVLLAALAAAASAQPGITPIHPSAGASDLVLLDLSNDGRVLVGYETLGPPSDEQVSRSVHWEAGALTVLPGVPSGTTGNQARAVSADGLVVFGHWRSPLVWPTSGGIYRWKADSVSQSPLMQDVDLRNGSADGWTAVGRADTDLDEHSSLRAVVWDARTGVVTVPPAPDPSDYPVIAHGVSADGAVVSGASSYGAGRAFRMVNGAVNGLGDLLGDVGWGNVPLSDDGGTLFARGGTGETLPWPGGGEATVFAIKRWRDGVVTPLPFRGNGGAASLQMYQCSPTAASPDGTVVAGTCIGDDEVEYYTYPSVIFREGRPTRLLSEILEDEYGLDLTGWDFECEGAPDPACYVFAIAEGGTALVGRARYNGEMVAYRVGLPSEEITVNDTGDEPDADPDDGACDTDPDEPGEQCTLRAAIETANAEAGDDRVVFDFSEADALGGMATITLESPLPPLTEPVEIDAAASADERPSPGAPRP